MPLPSDSIRIGICFCFAPKLHPAMRHVAAIRRQLGVRTLFNLLGPLCNPAGATHQLLGTSTPEAHQKIAAAIAQLGTTRSFVVHACDGQDEVSLAGSGARLDRCLVRVAARWSRVADCHRSGPKCGDHPSHLCR
jgi:anthranilate phosphoribosyltransferase